MDAQFKPDNQAIFWIAVFQFLFFVVCGSVAIFVGSDSVLVYILMGVLNLIVSFFSAGWMYRKWSAKKPLLAELLILTSVFQLSNVVVFAFISLVFIAAFSL